MADSQDGIKIGKESLLNTKFSRKIIQIRLLFPGGSRDKSPSDSLIKKLIQYYDLVVKWISEFEKKVDRINKIYFSLLMEEDKFDLFLKENFGFAENFKLFIQDFVKNRELVIVENIDLLLEYIGWLEIIYGPDASEIDFKFYNDVLNERLNFISKKINEDLRKNETGILFINSDNHMKFPEDIRVIYFRPPIVDDIIKDLIIK
ncbi:MAG: hypothetical protein ACTSRP_08985 [Candidatus Helarchaeota archaeon]